MRSRPTPWTAATFVAGSLVLLAACGGGTTPRAGGSSSPDPSVSAHVDGPIVIGAVGSFTGTHVGSNAGASTALTAWADYTNAHGGLLGRQVRIVIRDDHGDPTVAQSEVRDLVEAEHVVAIVADQSDVDQTWRKYVDSKDIPVVGGRPDSAPFLADANFFPVGANVVALTYGAQTAAKTKGTNYGSIVCAESGQCDFEAQAQREIADATGLKIAVDSTVASGTTDYTLLCQKLKTANVQAYQITAPAALVVAIATACAAQGVTASLVSTGTTLDSTWLAVPALQGTTIALATAPWFDTTIPGVATYRKAIADYAPGGLGTFDGPRALEAWAAGQLFAKAVLAAGQAVVTPSSIRSGLYALRSETLDGLVAPMTFHPDAPTRLNCYFQVAIAGGAFTLPQGNTPTCAPDVVVNNAVQKLNP